MKDRKNTIMIISAIVVIILAGFHLVGMNLVKASAWVPELGEETTAVMEESAVETPNAIRVPGYPRISLPADTTEVTMNLKNPEGNPCYFTFELVLTEGNEVLYTSKPVEPGKAITDVTLSRGLETGEYTAKLRITTTSLVDGSAMNGAEMNTVLVVSEEAAE